MSRASSRRECGLGQIGHAVGIGHIERGNLGDIRDHLRRFRRFAQRAFDLVVVAMADQHQRVALFGELDGLDMDLGHQRASGVNHAQVAALADLPYCRRNAVGRVDDALAVGHVIYFMNKNRAFIRQLVHNIAVMNNFSAHVNRRAKGFQRDLDNVDRTHHTGAKSARLE